MHPLMLTALRGFSLEPLDPVGLVGDLDVLQRELRKRDHEPFVPEENVCSRHVAVLLESSSDFLQCSLGFADPLLQATDVSVLEVLLGRIHQRPEYLLNCSFDFESVVFAHAVAP